MELRTLIAGVRADVKCDRGCLQRLFKLLTWADRRVCLAYLAECRIRCLCELDEEDVQEILHRSRLDRSVRRLTGG